MEVDASQAGIDVLRHGGNAVDAAVATASALGVTVPFVAGPGGGGFMVIYLAKTHEVVTIDGRENCPAACTTTMFLDPKTGQPLDYDYASDQPLATGVPSMVAAWAKAVSSYGRKSLAADLQPAIGVAERGFRVNQDFVQLTQADLPELQAYPASRALLLTPSGQPLPVGTLLRNPDLAKTYRLLARYGPSYLYNGPLGQAIVQADDHPVLTPGQTVVQLPGILTTADLRAYQARVLAPTRVRYRGLDIYSMAPPSSSGSTVGEALNILSGYNLSRAPRVTALFHYLEASRLAYADRNAYVGDPRYVGGPLSGLLDPAFAATRRCLIGNTALVSPVAPGNPYPPYGTCPAQGAQQPAAEGGGGRPHQQHRHRRQVGRRRRVHQHDQLLRRQWPDRAWLRLPAQQRDDRLRLRPAVGRGLRPEPAGRRQAAAVEYGTGHRVPGRPASVQRRRGRRVHDPHDHPADHPEPRGLRHVPAGRARRAAGEPAQRAHLAGRTRLLQQRPGGPAHQPVRREVHPGHRPDPAPG